jgi:hypothetical protein
MDATAQIIFNTFLCHTLKTAVLVFCMKSLNTKYDKGQAS